MFLEFLRIEQKQRWKPHFVFFNHQAYFTHTHTERGSSLWNCPGRWSSINHTHGRGSEVSVRDGLQWYTLPVIGAASWEIQNWYIVKLILRSCWRNMFRRDSYPTLCQHGAVSYQVFFFPISSVAGLVWRKSVAITSNVTPWDNWGSSVSQMIKRVFLLACLSTVLVSACWEILTFNWRGHTCVQWK